MEYISNKYIYKMDNKQTVAIVSVTVTVLALILYKLQTEDKKSEKD